MGLGGDPKVLDRTSVTVQELLSGSERRGVEESLKISELRLRSYRKLLFLTRVTRPHLLVVIVVLTLIIVALAASLAVLSASQCSEERGQTAQSAAENLKDGEVLPPCDDGWIWYRNKCYYFSEDEGTWPGAKDSCAALNSSLAMIDTQKELDFMLRYKGPRDHWIGLEKYSDEQWRWINGTEFNNWFRVEDYSDYAYLNHHSIKSGESYNTRNWICSKAFTYERKRKREKTLPSFQ